MDHPLHTRKCANTHHLCKSWAESTTPLNVLFLLRNQGKDLVHVNLRTEQPQGWDVGEPEVRQEEESGTADGHQSAGSLQRSLEGVWLPTGCVMRAWANFISISKDVVTSADIWLHLLSRSWNEDTGVMLIKFVEDRKLKGTANT